MQPLKKAVKNRVQYHGERCNRRQFIALRLSSTAEYHVLKSYIIDSLGPTNYFITYYTKKPKMFSDMSCSFSFSMAILQYFISVV